MLWSVKRAARTLRLKPHQVYYLVAMGNIEAVKVGRVWRLVPEAVADYDKQRPERKDREPTGYFIYTGDGGLLFDAAPDRLPPHLQGKAAGVERRRRKLVRRTVRPRSVLLQQLQPVTQLELF